jgi:hypothetical protein
MLDRFYAELRRRGGRGGRTCPSATAASSSLAPSRTAAATVARRAPRPPPARHVAHGITTFPAVTTQLLFSAPLLSVGCPMTQLALLDMDAGRKARGAFFTPTVVAEYLADWAIRSPSDRVLEPSCGEASFLLAAMKRFRDLGVHRPLESQLWGSSYTQRRCAGPASF